MRRAFEIAIEVSYYAGELWKIATDPDISRAQNSRVADAGWILKYGETSANQIVLPAQVSGTLKDLFANLTVEIDKRDGAPLDENTRAILFSSLSTLRKISKRDDPAPGYVTRFSNMQQALNSNLPAIEDMAAKMDLVREPVSPA